MSCEEILNPPGPVKLLNDTEILLTAWVASSIRFVPTTSFFAPKRVTVVPSQTEFKTELAPEVVRRRLSRVTLSPPSFAQTALRAEFPDGVGGITVAEGVAVLVAVGLGVTVRVAVAVLLAVAVLVGLAVEVLVAVAVAVLVAVVVGVLVRVEVGVRVAVAVAVLVGVA